MTDEINTEIKEEKRCGCDKKALKIFLLNILGSFLGCLVALCLYNAAVRPQMPPCPMKAPCPIQQMHHQKDFGQHKDFRGHKPEFKKDFKGNKIERGVVDTQRPQPPVQRPEQK